MESMGWTRKATTARIMKAMKRKWAYLKKMNTTRKSQRGSSISTKKLSKRYAQMKSKLQMNLNRKTVWIIRMPVKIPEVWKKAKVVILRVKRKKLQRNKRSITVRQKELMKRTAKIWKMLNKMNGAKSERTNGSSTKLQYSSN